MKRFITTFIVCLAAFATASVGVSAQSSGWHIDLAAGVNLFQGEDDAYIGLRKDRYTISPVLTAGHWFNPSVGIQGSIWGGKIKGLGIGQTPYATHSAPELVQTVNHVPDPWEELFNYGMFQLEGTFNFNNCLCGYVDKRVWNLIAHGGVEVARSYNDENNCVSFGGVVGFTNTWKVASRLNVFLDYTLTLFGKKFDLVTYRNNLDDMMTLRVGLSVNLGKKMKESNRVTVDTYKKAYIQDEINRQSSR